MVREKWIDLVFGSPPYCDARTYGIGAQRGCQEWIDWMLDVTAECLRVSKGAVVWVAASVTRKRSYWPAVEGLMYEWWTRGGSMSRPCCWRRHGIPGSGGDQWFRADVEYVACFKREGALPWADNVAMGHPPKCPPGGIVLDPFSGSGTTAKVALTFGRRAVASDVRFSQCELTRRRVGEVESMLVAM